MKLVLTISMALAATYLGLIAALLAARPKGNLLGEAVRLLPDLLRLLRRLAGDSRLPRADRVRLALLLGYLVLPIDLVPDFVPVLGYADDAILVSLVLRSVVRRAGAPVVRRHWPGTDDGLAALARLTGLEPLSQNATAPPDLARRASMTPAGRDHPDIHSNTPWPRPKSAAFALEDPREHRSDANRLLQSPDSASCAEPTAGFPCVARATANRSPGAPTGRFYGSAPALAGRLPGRRRACGSGESLGSSRICMSLAMYG
jgi:uncharacterized membrane protein YkvA (DUF1232 family)